jgi:hypothetical protein
LDAANGLITGATASYSRTSTQTFSVNAKHGQEHLFDEEDEGRHEMHVNSIAQGAVGGLSGFLSISTTSILTYGRAVLIG